jgi:hypothetical protein
MRRWLWLLACAPIGGACGSNEGAVGTGDSSGDIASLSDGGRDAQRDDGGGARDGDEGRGDASIPHYDGGSVPADAGPLAEYAVDPIAQPPVGGSLGADDKASSPMLLRDTNPAGGGDVFGVFRVDSGFYLLLSTDGGATWRFLPASGGAPPAVGVRVPATAITQDTSTYRVHWVAFPVDAPNALYHRVALAYAGGHIAGWSWEAADRPGPAFDASHGTDGAPRIALEEALDASGAHVLILSGVDQPSDSVPRRLVAARTSAGARALAPAATSDWGKVTDGSAGFSVLGAWSTGAPDPEALINFTGQDVDVAVKEHNSTIALAQLPADGSLNVFTGTMYFNDTDNHGDITRWRLTRGTSGWSLDGSASGKYIAPANPSVRPCLGNAVATVNYVWVTWGDARGMHVGRVDAGGAWSADPVASPDTATNVWWYSALNVADNEIEAWLMWERNDGTTPVDSFGRWDGASWTTIADTALWERNPSWVGPASGAAIWTPIGHRPRGVGVMAYGYAEWGAPTLHYSVHTTR